MLSHRLGLTLWQQAVADQTAEMPVLKDVWHQVVVEDRGMTGDALRTPWAIAPRIVAGGGNDVMVVKSHQPQLHHDIPLLFQDASSPGGPMAAAETVDVGHGRIEQRRLTSSTALGGYKAWPGLAQGFQIEPHVTMKASQVQRDDVVYGVTSLRPEQAGPKHLLRSARQHWQIENTVQGVREVTCDEDRSQGRGGSLPPVMATFRHTALS